MAIAVNNETVTLQRIEPLDGQPMTEPRRFPAPWTVEEIPGGFKVIDANGIAVSYTYARDDLAEKTIGGQHLTSDEARRIAANIARLPELLKAARPSEEEKPR